jgi:hypothetical protein
LSDWRSSRRKRLEAAAIAIVGYRAIRLLGATLRWHPEGLEHLDGILASGRQPVMAFWHGRILGATYYFRRRGIVVMTSENFDGEWISGIISRFGYGTARGSTSRGAARALGRMRREMAAGRPAGFAVDGPRGPAESVQPGAAWLAKATGNPILPFHIEASRCWTLRSWDRTQVPKPFSRMVLVVGEPIAVPADADGPALEASRRILDARLHALKARALERLRP